jgi:cytochrome c1
MIAGRLVNTSANLRRWLKSPQAISPGNAMPDQGLSDRQVRDVAAYLERLK